MPKLGYKQSKVHKDRIKANHAHPWLGKKRSPFSLLTKKKMSDSHTGEKSFFWKGDKASYYAKHIWINSHLGKAKICENRAFQILSFPCEFMVKKKEFCQNYNWAKKRGKRYSRDVKDYYQLCVSCHIKYDQKEI